MKGEVIPIGIDNFFKTFFLKKEALGYKSKLLSLITGISEEAFLEGSDFSSNVLENRSGYDKSQSIDVMIKVNMNDKEAGVINLEMNSKYYDGLQDKNTSYITKLFSTSRLRGESYTDTVKAIQINLDLFDNVNEGKFIRSASLRYDDGDKLPYSESLKIYHINLDFVSKKLYNGDVLNELERYVIPFIKTKDDDLKKFGTDKNTKDAIKLMKELSNDGSLFTEAERIMIKKWEDERILETAKSEGHKAGVAEGHKSGLAEGHKVGVAEGKEEKNKEIALKMLREKIDMNMIIKITGLTEREILELKN